MRRILILLCLVYLCGCMQSKNIDEYAYVLNVGVERGSTMPYLVTMLVSVPNGSEETKVENRVISAEARSFSEAYETLNAAYPSRLSFSRTSLLAIGEDLARNGGQTDFLNFAFEKTDLWHNLRVVVSRDPIREVFEGWISEGDPSLRKIKTTAGELMRTSGTAADTGYGTYREAVRDKRFDAMLAYAGVTEYGLTEDLVGNEAYPQTGGSLLTESILKTSIAGSAVFRGDRMVGVLDGRHTMEVLMVTGAFERGEMRFVLPDGQPITAVFYRMRAPNRKGRGTHASAELFLEADLLEPEMISMESDALRSFLEEQLETELSAVFEALQRVGSDAMGFGSMQVKRFKSAEEWEAYDWDADYRAMTVTFRVNVMLSQRPHDPGTE